MLRPKNCYATLKIPPECPPTPPQVWLPNLSLFVTSHHEKFQPHSSRNGLMPLPPPIVDFLMMSC